MKVWDLSYVHLLVPSRKTQVARDLSQKGYGIIHNIILYMLSTHICMEKCIHITKDIQSVYCQTYT